MIRLTKLRKAIAMFFLINIVFEIVAPHVSYALTAGPTAPEATSFEPVDTTDMVNLLSGDLAYNIPLLEVPGPEGGYPLSLSYHAGIQPNEEASWVGLGWTLNPGAINRSVNGYADDFNGDKGSVRNYFSGIRETRSVGLNIPLPGVPASFLFGLSFSQDTYLGSGTGAYTGIGLTLGGMSSSLTASNDGYGNSGFGVDAGINVGFNVSGVAMSANLTASEGGLGLSVGTKGLYRTGLGTSISSKGVSVSATVGGVGYRSGIHGNTTGKVNTQTQQSYSIPLIFASYSYSKVKYWSDETTEVATYGTLYNEPVVEGQQNDTKAYDVFYLYEKNTNIVVDAESDFQSGGSYPDYDSYSVLGQGIMGAMRPYILQSELSSQRKYIKPYKVHAPIKFNGAPSVAKPAFRFIGDFSNRYLQALMDFGDEFLTMGGYAKSFQFANPQYGNQDGNKGYDPSSNKLAGSRNIEYFTNNQILSKDAYLKGLRKPVANDESLYSANDQIGGFMITNESGVTYHYALPVYSYDEYSRTENIKLAIKGNPEEQQFTEQSRKTPYAYTWLLTAVTGPDYVDFNKNNMVDEQDWGYWVDFQYGKWTPGYQWKNPSEGYHIDDDANFRTYSKGYKEIYYLNYIKTRTHTAIFEKEIRWDGKSADNNYKISSAGSNYSFPVATLRLNQIYLINNKDNINNLASSGTIYNDRFSNITHEGANVVDKYDVDAYRSQLEEASIRAIRFNYDYSLCLGTTNSFGTKSSEYDIYKSTPDESQILTGTGKLTLNSIQMLGNKCSNVVPPMKFDYELSTDEQSLTSLKVLNGSTLSGGGDFEKGDILTFIHQDINFYCTVLNKTLVDAGLGKYDYTVKYFSLTKPVNMSSIQAKKTKNPPYNKDMVDMWGGFKSDYRDIGNKEFMSRITTSVSSHGVDSWSLRTITSSLGAKIKIDYESDVFSKSVLSSDPSLVIHEITKDGNDFKLGFRYAEDYILKDNFKVGDSVDLFILRCERLYFNYELNSILYYTSSTKNLNQKAVVTKVENDYIKVNHDPLFQECFYEGTHPGYAGTYKHKPLRANVSYIKDNTEGGGLRVKQISVYDPFSLVKSNTTYSYDVIKNGKAISSGITSYTPNVFPQGDVSGLIVDNKLDGETPYTTEAKLDKGYQYGLFKDVSYLLSNARLAPAPGVMYEYVTVESSIEKDGKKFPHLGKSVYQFEVFNQNMIKVNVLNEHKIDESFIGRNIQLKNFTAGIGRIKRITTYDNNNNKLTETINKHLNLELENESPQGVIQERFAQARIGYWTRDGGEDGTPYTKRAVMSSYEEYPSIQTESYTINYKTGIKTETKNLAYDFYSGAVTKQLFIDGYGNRFMIETKPAYTIYSSMGLKTESASNKNMLSQTAGTYTYKVDNMNNPIGLLSASIVTWSNALRVLGTDGQQISSTEQSNIWRKHKTYNWTPAGNQLSQNGITPYGAFQDYFASGGSSNPNWIKTSEISLYDVYSNALEVKDIYDNSFATRMGYNNSKVIVAGGPAKYDEIAFSGAEDDPDALGKFSTKVSKGNGVIVNDVAHTGNKSLRVSYGQKGFIYNLTSSQIVPGKDYIARVWVKNSSSQAPITSALYYRINSENLVYANANTKKAGDWYMIDLRIPGSKIVQGTNIEIGAVNSATSGEVYFDDFRFQPLVASSIAYVYNSWGELSYVLDNNNFYTFYEYDAGGRLIRTSKETLQYGVKKISEVAYNHSHQKDPNWQNTGTNRCQMVNDVYTGWTEVEQKDLNVHSTTYNTTRWKVTNQPCPYNITVYLYSQVASSYELILQNATETSKYYSFILPISSSSMSRQELSVPAGYYHISVRSTSGSAPNGEYNVQVGSLIYPTPAYFNNIDLRGNQTINVYQ